MVDLNPFPFPHPPEDGHHENITACLPKIFPELPEVEDFFPVRYKYAEDKNIAEFAEYIKQTYSGHYVGSDNIQAFDIWAACDNDPTPTHRNTAIKYLFRYGKKKGHNRDDLLKAMHYNLMLLYYHDKFHKEKV